MEIADKILDRQDRDGMLRRSLERIIQLYTDKSHFIYELLQNAEDAGATTIKFIQFSDRLEVLHDGHPFTTENLQGLCDIGKSDKINNLNQIGEFGVGFKSVFGICENVKLFSNPTNNDIADNCQPFSIEIQDFTKPIDIEQELVPKGYTTRFVFPYAVRLSFSGFKTIVALNNSISSRLKNLGVTTLLFMHNLKLIKYEIRVSGSQSNGEYMLKKKPISNRCTLVSAKESENNKTKDALAYLIFSRPIDNYASRRTVDIAFAVKFDVYGHYIFQRAENPYISVYFPTETESKLDFIVQGPFRTTPNRSSVPADDEENEKLVKETAKLLCASIIELRDKNHIDVSFLKILPLDKSRFNTYGLFSPLYDEVKNIFINEKILPSDSGYYISAGEAVIERSKGLVSLFTDNFITELFNDGREYRWLSTRITEGGEYKDVYSYCQNVLGIRVIRPEDLRDNFNNNLDFLPRRENEWLVRMYSLYNRISNIFREENDNILDAVIIKTDKNKFVAPYRKNGYSYIPNVFLPLSQTDQNEIDVVNPEVYEKCKDFFITTLRLKKPNEYEFFIKSVKKRYRKLDDIDIEQYFSDFKIMISYLNNAEYSGDLKKIVRESFAIKTKDEWIRPFFKTILMPQTTKGIDLEGYYQNIYSDVLFVDLGLYQSKGIGYEELKILGVSENILYGENITRGEYYTGNPGRKPEWSTGYSSFRWKLTINQIDDVLRYISLHPNAEDSRIKSRTIFLLLLDFQYDLHGNVSISGNNLPLRNEKSQIICTLRRDCFFPRDWDGKWLYTRSNELVSQKEISKHDLDINLYGKVKFDSDLYELLGFQKNEIDLFEDLAKEYDNIPEEKRKSFFEIELKRSFGINIDVLNRQFGNNSLNNSVFESDDDNEEYEFPKGNIKNWEALKKHAAQMLCYANPVKYDYVIRHIRTSRPQDDIRAYLMNMYRVNNTYKYACQLCHSFHSNVEMCQLEKNPEVELDPMNLCLCPSCAQKFRAIRNDDYLMNTLLDRISKLEEKDICYGDYVSIIVDGQDFWFTQTHIAEIRELICLKHETEKK